MDLKAPDPVVCDRIEIGWCARECFDVGSYENVVRVAEVEVGIREALGDAAAEPAEDAAGTRSPSVTS